MDRVVNPAAEASASHRSTVMRLRFSLRTCLILLTLFAACCYHWLARPSELARRFADAVNAEDFATADRLFRRADYQFLVDWAGNHWGFRARCELRPLSLTQLISARRYVDFHASYFELDAMVMREREFSSTPFGIELGASEAVSTSNVLIDRAESAVRRD